MTTFKKFGWNGSITGNRAELEMQAGKCVALEDVLFNRLDVNYKQPHYSDQDLVKTIMHYDNKQEPVLTIIYILLLQYLIYGPGFNQGYLRCLINPLYKFKQQYAELLQCLETNYPDRYKETIICIKARIENLQRYCTWLNNPSIPDLTPRYEYWFNKAVSNAPAESEKNLVSPVQSANMVEEGCVVNKPITQELIGAPDHIEEKNAPSSKEIVERAQTEPHAPAGMNTVEGCMNTLPHLISSELRITMKEIGG